MSSVEDIRESMDMRVIQLTTTQDAQRISSFFLSSYSFDDQRHTPGEIEHFRNVPLQSLQEKHHFHWYVENEAGEIVGVASCHENEHSSGGYLWDYIVVHRDYRKLGIASRLFETLKSQVLSVQGRYILTYTCDLPPYQTIQRMFRARGFEQIGHYPDFYYDGEGRIAFYMKL
jgi:GNAT superfamily N-acetyltransferase